MLAEIKLEALEWYYMEIDYAIKNNIPVTHEKAFEKTLDTVMRDLSEFEYMVWCFAILSRYERQMITMERGHIEDIKKAVKNFYSFNYEKLGLSGDEVLQLVGYTLSFTTQNVIN